MSKMNYRICLVTCFENGKIVVDEITSKERFGELFNNQSKLHSHQQVKVLLIYCWSCIRVI